MRVPLRERTFGELIGLCFSVTAGHFGVLFMLSALMNLPGALLASLDAEARKEPGPLFFLMTGLSLVILLLTAPIMQAATIRIVAGSFTGEPSPLGACLRVALRKMWTLIGYGMVTGLVMSLGFLACFAPGLMFMTWYYLGASALVIEDLAVGQAMARSKTLGDGKRWEILAFLCVTGFLFQGLSVGLSAAVGAFLPPRIAPWASLPFVSLLSMPLAVAPIVYYFNLRVAREGFDLDRLSTLIQGIGQRKSETPASG
jgi:hypothetical protein